MKHLDINQVDLGAETWSESNSKMRLMVPDRMVDLGFKINCRRLPIDHAHALAQALFAKLPWLEHEDEAGIHSIHGAASGNGWYRPQEAGSAFLHLPRRTRLYLRLPKDRIADAIKLTGVVLDIAGFRAEVGPSAIRKLSPLTTIFSRYVVADGTSSEEEFIRWTANQLRDCEVTAHKLMCGLPNIIKTPNRSISTRSVMLAELNVEDSIRLQEHGIGPARQLGCGLFLPHKGIHSRQDIDGKD